MEAAEHLICHFSFLLLFFFLFLFFLCVCVMIVLEIVSPHPSILSFQVFNNLSSLHHYTNYPQNNLLLCVTFINCKWCHCFSGLHKSLIRNILIKCNVRIVFHEQIQGVGPNRQTDKEEYWFCLFGFGSVEVSTDGSDLLRNWKE